MIYMKEFSDLSRFSEEISRQISVKSVIRLYGMQTETTKKRHVMGLCMVLLNRRVREFNLQLTIHWFSRYFLNKNVTMDFASTAEMDLFLEYDDWTVYVPIRNSLFTSMGACCNYEEIKRFRKDRERKEAVDRRISKSAKNNLA